MILGKIVFGFFLILWKQWLSTTKSVLHKYFLKLVDINNASGVIESFFWVKEKDMPLAWYPLSTEQFSV